MFQIASSWTSQSDDFFNTLHVRGGEAFAESIDRSRINFLVALLSKAAPHQKRILVDQRDKRIFRELNNIKGKNIVAVVNQWHMEGVETHWRRYTKTE
jgi:pheromone shutdown protein TraB